MKVTCSKCGTEYNFDDAKVTEEGVKVKCTRCENIFRVRKKAFVLTEPMQGAGTGDPAVIPAGDDGRSEPSQPSFPAIGAPAGATPTGAPPRKWLIRRTNGDGLDFNEMTTLQRWIVERRVERDDEISHNGVKWKRLGAIPELVPFFAAVEGGVPAAKGPAAPAVESPARVETPPPAEPNSLILKGRGADDAAERAQRRGGSQRPRNGRGAIVVGLAVLAAAGAGAWAQLTEGGRTASAPARAWLLSTTGIDLDGDGAPTAIVLETPATSPAPRETETPAETAVAVASPIASATAMPSPTAVAVATPAPSAAPSPVPTKVAVSRQSVDSLLQKGYEAYSRGRYKEAISKYQQAVNAAPDNSEAYALLGLAYLDAGQEELAESSLEASIRLNPRFADAYRYLGLVYSKRGDKARAVQSFTTYLELRPNGPTSDDIRKRVASLQGGG